WAVTTPTHVAAVVVSDIDYAAVPSLFVLDRRSGEQVSVDAIALLARGTSVPGTLDGGTAYSTTKQLEVLIEPVDGATRITARSERVQLDYVAELPAGHERLGVVVPWGERRWQSTIKDPARPASGQLTIADTTHELPAGEAWATLDHGRGRWPYSIAWNWGSGAGRVGETVVGLQVGGRWTDGTGSTENAIIVDGT